MQSLAKFLLDQDEGESEDRQATPAQGRPRSAKVISRTLLNSSEYRQSLVDRISLGELPPAVECKLWEYAYGKPIDRVEVKDTTPSLGQLTAEQLEERALRLAQLARQMREQGQSEKDDQTQAAVH